MADLQVSSMDMQGSAEPTNGKRSDYYLKVLSFVASNAWCGENIAVENYSEMVPLMPTVEAKIEAVHQAKEEAKHILLLEKLAQRLGFPIDETMLQDDWPKVRATFHEAAQKGDLAACLIIQDLMIESLAVGIYSTFANEDNKDVETQRVAAALLKDEIDHLDIGLRRIGEQLAIDSEGVHDSLVWAHNRIMPCLFNMVHTACDFLCDRKDVPCEAEMAFVQDGVLHLSGERKGSDYIDLDRLKITSLEHYVAMLDRAGFNLATTNQLIASMSAYEVPGRTDLGIRHILQPKPTA
jgi:fatty aldehyde decarbonylase